MLGAARGVGPVMCSLAGMRVANGGHGDAPPIEGGRDATTVRWALRPTVDERDRRDLVEGLRDGDGCVREIAARILGSTGTEGAAALLAALDDPDVDVRRSAAAGLGYADYEPATRALIRALADDDRDVRARAAWTLGRMEARAALEPLLALLRDEDPQLRATVARAIGDLVD